jgi:diguanylate cyclase (GGDEF)-like protein/PAS domain S-box-containing protein
VTAATQNIHKKKIILDLLILTLATIVIVQISTSIDLHEKFINFTKTHDLWEADDILLSGAVCLLFGFIWFTWRRLQDSLQAKMIIQNSESRFRSLIDSTDNSIYLVDRNYKYLFINKKHLARIGANEHQYIGQPFSAFHPQKETELFIDKAEKMLKAGKPMEFTYKSLREDKYYLQTYSPVMGKDNEPIAITVISKDITELKHMEEELRALSLKDDLTGLYNRRGFTTLAEQHIKMANRGTKGFFMLYADLDNLKMINDKFGHQEGNYALIKIANILTDIYRESDIVARLGGDEFVVLPVVCDGGNIDNIISRLQDKINSFNAQSNRVYKLSLSVGTSYFDPENPYSLDKLLSNADEAMYEQKKNKRTSAETPMTSFLK